MSAIEIIPLSAIGEVRPGEDLVATLASAVTSAGTQLGPRDVLIVTQKIVSKAEGRQVDLRSVEPSARARAVAADVDAGSEAHRAGAGVHEDRRRHVGAADAVRIAREEAQTRDDVFTADALAWALFKADRPRAAARAIAAAGGVPRKKTSRIHSAANKSPVPLGRPATRAWRCSTPSPGPS